MEDAKRAKRNHKIFLLSRDNGLMTPQDKNFITRIQLQQLVTATGNPNDHVTDSGLSEDFYYQVHNQIRGGPRQHPGQPLSHFAQTYLFQTGGRHGGMRRQARGGDNHMQRMEQQVQRAVEAAKNKPKNKQLVIEGSLGKISFSNAKTPKPLLNIKRNDSSADTNRPGSSSRKSHHGGVTGSDRKTVLTDIENVYTTLMKLEDHERHIPPPLNGDVNPELVGLHMDWQEKAQSLNQQLWRELKVHEPIGATSIHPFIAFLSFSKGKKIMPRVFRHISQEQRATILTMIVVHLDQLDVVRQAVTQPGESILFSSGVRENIELFSLSVMPPLFAYLNEAGLDIATGVLGLILGINIDIVARTRIGVSMLTMILSRAELIKQTEKSNEQEWESWVSTYNRFFDTLEPTLPNVFPGTVNSGEDIYVWQFLAAIGIGASPEQQQRLVLAVKDRVMETVALAKTLPPEMSSQRLANVNLFMRSIGLDVELLA
jgi:DNA topoisomerase 2-associated protein PAT1